MFALLLLATTSAAQEDYCAITPKHTACGQKVSFGKTAILEKYAQNALQRRSNC